MRKGLIEIEYHSKDFEWEQLRQEIEQNPLFTYHLTPHHSINNNINFPINTNININSNNNIISNGEEEEHDSEAWNKFHTVHSTGKFFKERKYLLKEFPELLSCVKNAKVLEVGCGNGSTVLPILRGNEDIIVYACDCSPEALKRAQDIIDAAKLVAVKDRFHTFTCDFSVNGFPNWLAFDNYIDCSPQNLDTSLSDVKDVNEITSMDEPYIDRVDFVTLIFTLSAVPFPRMPAAIAACFSVLKPGGMLLFRDYGLYDMAMLRFEPEKKVGFREYIRPDGTRSYFFSLDIVKDLFFRAGFYEVELEYCCVKSVNRRSENPSLSNCEQSCNLQDTAVEDRLFLIWRPVKVVNS